MAFPTQGILDNFDRADQAPITTSWTVKISTGDANCQLISNALGSVTGGGAGAWSGAYYDLATFGPDCEAYATITTVAPDTGSIEMVCRISEPNTANVDCYFALLKMASGADTVQLYKIVNAVESFLSGTTTAAFAAGDSFGVEAIGTTIKFYYKSGAGAWTQLLSFTDSSITGAGYIGCVIQNSAARVDNFGGGTVGAGAAGSMPFQRYSMMHMLVR